MVTALICLFSFDIPLTTTTHTNESFPEQVQSHMEHMEKMVLALSTGSSPLLLIGDQGTGKNKITDRLLQLMKLEREYMQLHRDSTVQSLTVVPTLTEGALEWVDSPLVSAIKHGRVIVIDEAGKDVLGTSSTISPHSNTTPNLMLFFLLQTKHRLKPSLC